MTADEKTNWWRTAKLGNEDRAIGPHFELIRDVESASGKRFMMYTQEGFLLEAPKYLGVPDQKQAIKEVKQIQNSGSLDTDTDLSEAPKASPLEEPKRREKPDLTPDSGLMEKDRDLSDAPKASPLEEPKSREKAEPEDEGAD